MPLVTLTFLSFCVFATSMLSGVFGMAGGMVLMVILLALLPVQAAMAVHAAVQLVANGWRCFLWRRHIVWHVIPPYAAGMALGLFLLSLIAYVPDKTAVLIMLGSVPLLAIAAERWIKISIMSKGQTFVTASILTFIQMSAGVVGPLLDLLYNNAPLTRHQIISTKAFTQSSMHLVRLIYFGTLVPMLMGGEGWPEGITMPAMAAFIACSIAGTSAAAWVLHRMDDRLFKRASRVLIICVSLYCLGTGLYRLVT